MSRSVDGEAKQAVRTLTAQARPAGDFDPSRYFRATEHLEFLNVRTPVVRSLGREIARAHRDDWTIGDALAFADRLMADNRLEVKGVAIETLACFRRAFTPALLPTWKRWLATNLSANWATTDSICGSLISPVLLASPEAVPRVTPWACHRNLWVRRAAAVSLVRLAARGLALEDAYGVVDVLRGDQEDLIQKAAGWLLREAGRTDAVRLRQYLRRNGRSMPRTTIRYAVEKFPPEVRSQLLVSTRPPRRAPRVPAGR